METCIVKGRYLKRGKRFTKDRINGSLFIFLSGISNQKPSHPSEGKGRSTTRIITKVSKKNLDWSRDRIIRKGIPLAASD